MAKVSFLRVLEIRHLKRGMLKIKKENIHVKGNLPIKSQELNPEDNEFRGFQELCGRKSSGYAVMNLLMPSS